VHLLSCVHKAHRFARRDRSSRSPQGIGDPHGAQAIYLRTGNATFALAEATKDSDLAIDTRELGEDPLLEVAMTSAGFILNPVSQQPGAWMSTNSKYAARRRPDWRPRSSISHR
jgi:hypothetical protein